LFFKDLHPQDICLEFPVWYASRMARTPQTAEMLSVAEMKAIREILEKSKEVLDDAEALCAEKQLEGLFVVYKPAILRTADALRRLQASLYQSTTATKLGKPMTANSISSRSKRVAKAKAQVIEVRKQLRKKGHSGE